MWFLPAVTTTNSWGSAYSPAGYVTTLKCNATIGEVTMEIDISNLRGEYYIALGINQGYGYYKSIRLEI